MIDERLKLEMETKAKFLSLVGQSLILCLIGCAATFFNECFKDVPNATIATISGIGTFIFVASFCYVLCLFVGLINDIKEGE